ncbi:MAG: hypothetical protein DI604_30290 [Delftia acidovorans]|nr:MAG: hypothetical protein DI604_30290 [Delftia acidovorans]
MTTDFRVITEDELGVIRLTECEHEGATWNLKSTKRGLVISRDDDHANVSLLVPLAMTSAFCREIAEQRSALKDGAEDMVLIWGGPSA